MSVTRIDGTPMSKEELHEGVQQLRKEGEPDIQRRAREGAIDVAKEVALGVWESIPTWAKVTGGVLLGYYAVRTVNEVAEVFEDEGDAV